ncbi:acetate/propionate family kinase [Lacticaseibacillus sharpeae]|uniref:Acetate kinase n=1 Tax=Lacticaseibacillus sharpeae JCM 1186 = DSM 20505 TaxID=1291052 RepID=A0A0R1ZIJ7_9LACO|nr:acetate kinase [Lacticaseibacillus sharpeae]KRM54750.1 acetate kinase [Lacticaseibacillus sharpeae JCM 1186 = DSM 20505]
MAKILAVNTGSSTLKWKLFQMPEETVIAGGMVDRLGLPGSKVKIKYGDGQEFKLDCEIKTADEAVELLLDKLLELKIISDYHEINGVGHRVVAGGEVFKHSTLIDRHGLQQIMDLAELAPLHNPAEARGIAAFMHALPDVPEVGVFDTSFHTSLPAMNYLYSIPTKYYKQFGLRKYGAHGTSVRFVASRTAEILHKPLADLRLVVMHMGSGVSVTAVQNGVSFDTSMGYTPVSGVTMSTRSGDIDPSLVAMLMKKLNITDPDRIITLLNNKSGVYGLSGLSPDMREIEATIDTRPESKLAIDVFVNRMIKYVAGYIAEMGGVDAIVFTAGMGEADAAMRKRIVDKLAVFGLKMDEAVNDNVKGEADITASGSSAQVLVVPTNEELMIARDVCIVGECL